MVRLYSKESFPFPVVEELRRRGHDVLTLQETGKAGQALPDEAVLAFAVDDNGAVLTLNRKHFIRLHRQDTGHVGVIVCTFDPDFAGPAERIHRVLQAYDSPAGQLIRVNGPA